MSRDLPKISCVCLTYLRPDDLAEVIECFRRQDYPLARRELIILDDAGQYENQAGAGWQLISSSRRYQSIGQKRNAAAALISPDSDAIAIWDDDDLYLPWHLSAAAKALASSEWSKPSQVWTYRGATFEQVASGAVAYNSSWVVSRELFERVGGYPWTHPDEDQIFGRRLHALVEPADPCAFERPSMIYRWCAKPDAFHMSSRASGVYEELACSDRFARVDGGVQPLWTRDWTDLVLSQAESPRQ